MAQYTALYNADVAGYKQTVLTPFQQTEGSLSSLRLLTQQIEQQRETVASAQRNFDYRDSGGLLKP